jgi:hypothetical protein
MIEAIRRFLKAWRIQRTKMTIDVLEAEGDTEWANICRIQLIGEIDQELARIKERKAWSWLRRWFWY